MQIKESVEEYLDKSDWRVNANANQGYSIGGLILNTAGKVIANYWLNEVYSKEASNAHRSGDLHIHDLDMLSPYCAGWSLRTLLTEGFNGVDGKIEASPSKHISSALGQCLNFLGTLQNEWAGAMAFSGFDTYLAPIIKIENPEYSEIKQCVQEFVYGLNVSTRWGMQSPFSNITFDLGVPNDLKEQYPTVGGKVCNFTYGECQEEADLVAKAFCEIMLLGDAKRRPFSYPIPTYNITKEFNWDSEIADLIFQMAGKYGLPYFQNFLNSSMKPEDVRSMCPLMGNTKVVVKRITGGSSSISKVNEVEIRNIESIHKSPHLFEVLHEGKWSKAITNKQYGKYITFTGINGVSIEMGLNHLQPIIRDAKELVLKAKEIKKGDYLPFSNIGYMGNNFGTYNLGFVLGAYAGDGSGGNMGGGDSLFFINK